MMKLRSHTLAGGISRPGTMKVFVLLMLLFPARLSAQQSGTRPNILLIAVDDLKPTLGCYGDSIAISPHIDRLAQSGTVFLNNHCQQAVCTPSRSSFLTGLRPDNTKVWDLNSVLREQMANIVTLPQYFKNNGYETAATGKVFHPGSVDAGHDAISWSVPYADVENPQWLISAGKVAVEAPENPEEDFADAKLMAKGMELLDSLSRKSKPFFLAVGFRKPHLPFVAPKKYWDLYARHGFAVHLFQSPSLNGVELAYHESGELRGHDDIPDAGPISADQQKELIHGYYACVSFVDNVIGRLVGRLEQLGLRENTIIVVWGDHGWHLGDHGLWGKHTNFEQATRSPLIIAAPMKAGRQSTNSPTEFVDVFPTLCELAGIQAPKTLDGKSLVPVLDNPGTSVKECAISQFHRAGNGVEVEGYALRTERYRYIEWLAGKYKNDRPYNDNSIYARELYDYETDPHETANIVNDSTAKDVVAGLHGSMKSFFANLKIIPAQPLTKSQKPVFVLNPGFEEGVAKGWSLTVWEGYAATLEETSEAFAGRKAAAIKVKVADPSNVNKVALLSDSLVSVPRGKLTFSVHAKASLNGAPMKLSLRCYNAAGDVKYYSSAELPLTTGYQRFVWDATPDTTYLKRVNLRLQCGKVAAEYFIDSVDLVVEDGSGVPLPGGRRLREIVADRYPEGRLFIGGTTSGSLLGTASETILQREFSYVTPANDFKQTAIHPQPGVWDWTMSDRWVNVAKANNQVIRMHSPVSPQCSDWARDDARTPAELLQNLEEYVTELCKRYHQVPQIRWMDVVNETIDKNTGAWLRPKPGTDVWENPWPAIGYDTTHPLRPPLYIRRAFELANQFAPDIKQIINQHTSMEPAAWEKVKALVSYLREKGLRVDGIGFQGHVDAGWENEGSNLESMGALIDWAHANDLEFHVTENNVFLEGQNTGNWEAQAATFGAIVQLVRDKRRTGVVTWNLWQVRDSDGEKSASTPSVFFADGSAKPAYYRIQSILDNPTTDLTSVGAIPSSLFLYPNYPNPFNPETKILYAIPPGRGGVDGGRQWTTLQVYDMLGNLVATVVEGYQTPGVHESTFNAKGMATGIYFYRITAGPAVVTGKMILMR